MINTKRFLKATAGWISITYILCFALSAAIPSMWGEGMGGYGFHMMGSRMGGSPGFSAFIYGLIFWNVAALWNVWLFSTLWNKVRE